MKRNLVFILAFVAIFLAAAAMKPVHQDDPVKKKNAHIRIMTIKDGKEEVLDTIIESGNVRVFHSGKGKEFVWTTAVGEKMPDSLLKHLEIIKEEADGKNVIIRRGTGRRGPVVITETETLGDSGKKVIVHVEKVGPGEGNVLVRRPGVRQERRLMHAPFAPGLDIPLSGVPFRRHLQGRNIIDLTDPGIISYEKKKLPGGREKITIIRNEVKQENEDVIKLRMGDKLKVDSLNDLPGVHREIKVKKGLVSPEEIRKK